MKLSQLLQEKCQDIQAIAARPHFKCQIKRLTLSIRRIVQPLKHLLLHFFPPVNNSLIDYPAKRYDRAFEIASDVINENFTARFFLTFVYSSSPSITNLTNSFTKAYKNNLSCNLDNFFSQLNIVFFRVAKCSVCCI